MKRFSDIFIAVIILGIVLLIIIPLPTFMMDFFLILNISVALLILLITLYTKRTLDFSTYPTVLLIATIARLALNISSTRLILGNGGDAGHVIKAFGSFVVGENLVVGLVIFLIIVVVQFIVITKGAERVAEVAARFTLDAMPGKQMAIDADLSSGLINEAQARERREDIQREADFYGAMDGASKFVKGDAIVGIVITLINIIGGNTATLKCCLDGNTAQLGGGHAGKIPLQAAHRGAGTGNNDDRIRSAHGKGPFSLWDEFWAQAVSPNSSRPISMRRISLVPAPISYSLASRSKRPVGYSLI